MKLTDLKSWFPVLLMLAALHVAPASLAMTPDNWKDTGFSIDASGMKFNEVLKEFGQAYGVRISNGLRGDKLMKGKLRAESGGEFLDRLTQEYQFRWFVYNNTLYVTPRNDNTSLRLQVGEDAVQDAKAALTGLGLFDSRFGWGELPDEGIVIVSGPRAYVELARGILLPEKKDNGIKGKEVMMFRLRYASATDRTINVRGQSETVPGIKTILSGLLASGNYDRKSDSMDFDAASKKRSRTPNIGRGDGRDSSGAQVSRRDNVDEVGSERPGKGKPAERGPRIEADPSLNAIFVYDEGSKRAMYQALITELDVEPQQVEIEALIVDIQRSKLAGMGVEWGGQRGDAGFAINGTNAPSQGVDLPLPGSTLLISNAARFYARLKAMEGTGEARVLGKPTVLTLDNVAAVLDLSQTAYLPLVGERVADLANVTAGTMLRVVPRIVRENGATRVRMEIDIEDGNLGDSTKTATSVTRSTISTQAIVEPQQTLMIGGYHSESTSFNRQKVPVLGDVPLFGGLFRSNDDSASDRERLFLITPRLVGVTGRPAPKQSKVNKLAQAALAQEPTDDVATPQASPGDRIGARETPAAAPAAVPAPAGTDSTPTAPMRGILTGSRATVPGQSPPAAPSKPVVAPTVVIGQSVPFKPVAQRVMTGDDPASQASQSTPAAADTSRPGMSLRMSTGLECSNPSRKIRVASNI